MPFLHANNRGDGYISAKDRKIKQPPRGGYDEKDLPPFSDLPLHLKSQ